MAELLKILEKENRNKSEENFIKVLYMEEEYIQQILTERMPTLKLDEIKKVNNNFLEGFYLLTKEEYKARFGSCEERILFHVTAAGNVDSIIKDNLDWRRTIRSMSGKGVYFADDPSLANSICNQSAGVDRAIIVCKVLMRKVVPAHGIINGPINDTVSSYHGRVFTKFNDNEFLPIFVAFYKYEEFH